MKSGVSTRTIRLFEIEERQPYPRTLESLRECLEGAGIVFLETEAGRGLVMTGVAERE